MDDGGLDDNDGGEKGNSTPHLPALFLSDRRKMACHVRVLTPGTARLTTMSSETVSCWRGSADDNSSFGVNVLL